MAKMKPQYGGMIDELPDDPGEPVQANANAAVLPSDNVVKQSDIHTTKQATSRRRKRAEPEAETKAPRFVQRPLYATEEMIEAVREWAFKNKRPAQEFYREGLLLRLHEAGLCKHITRADLSE